MFPNKQNRTGRLSGFEKREHDYRWNFMQLRHSCSRGAVCLAAAAVPNVFSALACDWADQHYIDLGTSPMHAESVGA